MIMNLNRIKDIAGTGGKWFLIIVFVLSFMVGVFLFLKPGILMSEDVAINAAAIQNYRRRGCISDSAVPFLKEGGPHVPPQAL